LLEREHINSGVLLYPRRDSVHVPFRSNLSANPVPVPTKSANNSKPSATFHPEPAEVQLPRIPRPGE
jgi:hypothetical protein